MLRLGTWDDEPNDTEEYQYDRLEDMVHATATSFLGLTVKCARCHDHKFDPIPQTDYYRLRAIFEPALDTENWRLPGARLVSLMTDADEKVERVVRQLLADCDSSLLRETYRIARLQKRSKPASRTKAKVSHAARRS